MKSEFNNTKAIAIDSNILTYYVKAVAIGYDPDKDKDNYRKEKIASLRIPLYSKWYGILPTVRYEYLKISEKLWRTHHFHADQVFIEYPENIFPISKIKERASYFNEYHKGEKEFKDCMIAAEAEFLSDTTVLLSNDTDFIKNVSPLTKNLLIIRPTEFVEKFNVSNNKLRVSPAKTNPLFSTTWWRF